MAEAHARNGTFWREVIQASRPSFLLLTPLCVALGLGTAMTAQADWNPWRLVLVTLGALLAHAAVNLLNEAEDFRSGLDLQTSRTSFSGGSGTLPAQPAALGWVQVAAWVALGLVVAIGLWLVIIAGPGLLLLGAMGLILVTGYSGWIVRSPLMCLMAPGLGIGLMVPGTHYAMTGTFDNVALVATLVPALLCSALLLVNQIPDTDADRRVRRRHLPIVLGRERAAIVFALLVMGAYVALMVSVGFGALPAGALAGLLPLPVAIWLVIRVRRHARDIPRLVPWLGVNVAVVLTTIGLMAAGLMGIPTAP
ncbi:prenyltransferase [Thioalkalivibrio sp. ALJT]|uniref:prenyltransferase n=1 Tax=Thioalkalivibrio sp. ALJT TaxID=1158146 RepID=UPI00037D3542|nr:prenyltransferase [Thioalkalivibrio sp. ALJT]